MYLPLKYCVKTYKNPHLSLSSRYFLVAGWQGCQTSQNALLAKNQPKKPKMYLPLKSFVETYKNLHLSLSSQYFLVAGWQGCQTSPNALLTFKNTLPASKTLKQGWLNYKNLSYVVWQIKPKKFEIAPQNRPKVHFGPFGPARPAKLIFQSFFTSSTFFGNDLRPANLCRPKKCSK